jgi:hypothetical protein
MTSFVVNGEIWTNHAIILAEGYQDIILNITGPDGIIVKRDLINSAPINTVQGVYHLGNANKIILECLCPGQIYCYTISGTGGPEVSGKIKTLSDCLDYYLVSCNNIKEPSFSMWSKMHPESDCVDYCFHVGDQIYGDFIVDDMASPSVEYPELYRMSYADPEQQRVMRNVGNMMIPDDHELHDALGTPQFDVMCMPENIQARNAGILAYYRYQHNMRYLDLDFDQIESDLENNNLTDLPVIYKFDRLGCNGYLYLDIRFEPFFHKIKEPLGIRQKKWLSDLFLNGSLNGLHKLYVFMSRPIGNLPIPLVLIGGLLVSDLRDDLLHPEKIQDTVFLLKLLSKLDAEILINAGDVHSAGVSDIYHENCLIAKQVYSSAVSRNSRWDDLGLLNLVHLWLVRKPIKFLEYHVKNDILTFDNNVAIVRHCNSVIIRTPLIEKEIDF